ncbi:MAG: ABC-type transport auxiliary lipoprotein family protein [Ignavibacteria bacterium]|jgi:ABC-type uncharacterized transport system auxiliary subunit|nr:ABC-type transport auxiliary lipoprotein family protein [Ignavibacteria bacterium]
MKNYNKRLYFIALILIVVSITGCISIKSKYPESTYYKLTQVKPANPDVAMLSTDNSIFIRDFEINSDIQTSKIVVSEDVNTIKRYNYHQWTAPLNDVITEFTMTRISNYGTFKKGVATSIYTSNPDYVLECNILTCNINNHPNNVNNVEVSISAILQKSDHSTIQYVPVFSKTYTKIINRNDNSIESAVVALSNAISQIDDEILIDIFANITQ